MSVRVLMILRGRPGLGHVIPGFAIAQRLARRGHAVKIMTYRNGVTFLRSSGWGELMEFPLEAGYIDWPGLDPYDHGVNQVLPAVEDFSPDLILLGGEYLLPPALAASGVPVGLLYNPEIFDVNERNLRPAGLFAAMLGYCDFLIPMGPVDRSDYLPEGEALASLAIAHGPFMPRLELRQGKLPGAGRREGILVVVANGGGVDFPARADSYSSHDVEPAHWLAETMTMTRASVEAALASSEQEDRIQVFSCLGPEFNAWLASLKGKGSLTVESPNVSYYEAIAGADVVISRAGAGFLVDAGAVPARVVGWALAGHDEQLANLRLLTRGRPRSWECVDDRSARETIGEAMAAAREDAWRHQCFSGCRNGMAVDRAETAAVKLVETALSRLPDGEQR